MHLIPPIVYYRYLLAHNCGTMKALQLELYILTMHCTYYALYLLCTVLAMHCKRRCNEGAAVGIPRRGVWRGIHHGQRSDLEDAAGRPCKAPTILTTIYSSHHTHHTIRITLHASSQVDPAKRPTAAEVMSHPWVSGKGPPLSIAPLGHVR
jgi:hypothetical protein